MASKKPPVIVKSTLPSLEQDMTNVVVKGVVMPIRKEEVEVWNRLSAKKKKEYLKKWQKLQEQGKVWAENEATQTTPVKLFKKPIDLSK